MTAPESRTPWYRVLYLQVLLAVAAGLLLDPVYTAKAMAALIADVRQRRLAVGDVVVFIHTGGVATILDEETEP